MTGSEALGMLLGKEIYDSVKNKINADDCYDVIRYIVLNEIGILDNKGNLSESIKNEIREELKTVIFESFFNDSTNQQYLKECIKKAFMKNEFDAVKSIFDDNDTSWQDHECERCECERHECEKETSKEKEEKEVEEQADFATSVIEMMTNCKCSEDDKKAIQEACKILNKAFGDKL